MVNEQKVESKKIEKEKSVKLYEILSKPIPEEYLYEYTEDGKKLRGYNAQYAINLLNEVIGLGKWVTQQNIRKEDFLSKGYYVVMDLSLIIPQFDIKITGHSAAYAKRIENAYKGAKTSAFKAACKYLGIGNELYLKNEVDEDITYVKEEQVKEEVISQEATELEKKINDCRTVEQLESLSAKVNSAEGKAVKVILFKKYNQKKIMLSDKK